MNMMDGYIINVMGDITKNRSIQPLQAEIEDERANA